MGKTYYLAKNGLEYPEYADAVKYGGGAVGQQTREVKKTFEPLTYEDIQKAEAKSTPQVPSIPLPTSPSAQMPQPFNMVPQAVSEFDNMDVIALKEALKAKGYGVRGNPKRETLLAKLKSLQSQV